MINDTIKGAAIALTIVSILFIVYLTGVWQEARFGQRVQIYDCAIVVPDNLNLNSEAFSFHNITINGTDGGICFVHSGDYILKFHSSEDTPWSSD